MEKRRSGLGLNPDWATRSGTSGDIRLGHGPELALESLTTRVLHLTSTSRRTEHENQSDDQQPTSEKEREDHWGL